MVNAPPVERPGGPQGLLRRVLASDLVDKLTAPHGVDRYLELVDPSWVVREPRVEIERPAARTETTESSAPNTTAGSTVTFERSELTATASGTVLETAEAAGLSPRSRCRRGVCGTCTTPKTAGVVRNLVTGLESEDRAEPIRICVSVACGDVAVDL